MYVNYLESIDRFLFKNADLLYIHMLINETWYAC